MGNWVYVVGGFAVVTIAGFSGSKWGAMLIVLIVLGMLFALKEKGVITQ